VRASFPHAYSYSITDASSRLVSGFDSLVASVSIYVQIEAVGARKEQSTTQSKSATLAESA
jgi:hypothetical protein